MFALESVVLWLLALPPGLFLGWYTTVALARSFSTELFTMSAYIAPRSYLITALGILSTMLLASRPAIRRIGRLNLAEATKMLT
jgi:ABC-type antimicrobial peptide transport system permease subunit